MRDKTRIAISSQQCTGCLLCKLACSMVKTKKYSYSRAQIEVARVANVERYRVSFKSGCDGCGYCVQYCAYDALTMPAVGAAAS